MKLTTAKELEMLQLIQDVADKLERAMRAMYAGKAFRAGIDVEEALKFIDDWREANSK